LPQALEVEVRDSVETALKKLKKKMAFEGVFREIKKRRYYEKPSEKRKRKREDALRRIRKRKRRYEQYVKKNKKYRNYKNR
jgi:small subunit ribosomal protein S21